MNIVGNAGPASTAPAGDGITAGMTPVQKDCWAIFNHPNTHARESGAGIDEVRLQACLQCILGVTSAAASPVASTIAWLAPWAVKELC